MTENVWVRRGFWREGSLKAKKILKTLQIFKYFEYCYGEICG